MRLELLSPTLWGLRRGALAWLIASTAGVAPALALQAPAPQALARLATASSRPDGRPVAPRPALKPVRAVAAAHPAFKPVHAVAAAHPTFKPVHAVAASHPALEPIHAVAAAHSPLKPVHPLVAARGSAVATPAPVPAGGSGAAPAGPLALATTSLPPASPSIAAARSSAPAQGAGAGLAPGGSAGLPLTEDAMASVDVPPPPPPLEPVVPASFDPLAEAPGATPAPDFVLVPPATLALPVSSSPQLARYFPNPLAESPSPAVAPMQAAAPTPAPATSAPAPEGPTEPIIRLQRQGQGIHLETEFLPQDEDFVLTASIPQGPTASPSPAPAAAPAASAGAPQSRGSGSDRTAAIRRREDLPSESSRSENVTYTQRMVWQTPPPVSVASESIAVLELYSTAQQLAYAHNLDLAMLSLDKALAMEPTNPTLLALQGSLYYGKGAVDLARRSWAQALLYDPTMSDVRTALAHVSSAPAFQQ